MQNSRHQIINKQLLYQHWSIILMILLFPLLLYAVIHILPTHDDWTSMTAPDFNPFFIKERFLFYGYHWRPFDAIIGYIAGRNPLAFFPTMHHILVVSGHLLCSISIYHLLSVLGFNRQSTNIATFFFFITPAAMATVSAVDSQNQVYALTCDVIALLLYVKLKKRKYIVWITLVFLATLFKENGLMWALICPILAYGFDLIDKKTFKKDILAGFGIMAMYALVITILPKDITIHSEYVPSITKVIHNSLKFLFTSFITIDYIYLLHQPHRNLGLAGATFLMALPFFYYIFIRNMKIYADKKMICILLCLLIAVAPHVFTVFSMMHTYAGLALIAIMIAYSIQSYQENIKPIIVSFLCFIITAIIINIHLIDSSVKSGLIGKKIAIEAIQKTEKPVKNVYLIMIEEEHPKLSSFCVIPYEAFGWGLAARHETNYQWPETIIDTTIVRNDKSLETAKALASKQLKSETYDCAWIVNHQDIMVIPKNIK